MVSITVRTHLYTVLNDEGETRLVIETTSGDGAAMRLLGLTVLDPRAYEDTGL